MVESNLEKLVEEIAQRALNASYSLASLSTEKKNAVLARLAAELEDPGVRSHLEAENKRDIIAGETAGLTAALLDRLKLTPARLDGMVVGIRQVAALPDPVGEELERRQHSTGFSLRKIRVPIGVIGIVYESRPNVTIDCAVLCLKSGNATILRGGREAFHSNQALAAIITRVLVAEGINPDAVQLIPTTDRYALSVLMKLDQYVHCLIPRGGEGLIRFVAENARMPVIKHYKGVCNVYIDPAADIEMAVTITVNAKCQRPSVCNAAENLVVHRDVLESHFLHIARALHAEGVELRVDRPAADCLHQAGDIPFKVATEEDFHEEYLDKVIAVRTVDSLQAAIDFINNYGSGHSDAIVTADSTAATAFQQGVDSSSVYWNVSTRFTDGFEFGLGAEIGISTDKLHARGPMGLTELTSYKFLIDGHGEIRN